MYIDTTDACSIICSVGNLLNIDRKEIMNVLCEENEEEKFREFLFENFNENMIDEILIHHLSRKIEGVNMVADLQTILLTDNAMSQYLLEKEIVFKKGINELALCFKGKVVDIDTCKSSIGVNKSRIKQRFCTNNEINFSDSMINGYVIGDVDKETTYHFLADAPEIITDLSYLLNDMSIKEDFRKISKFYIWSYKIPFKECKNICGTPYTFKDLINQISYYLPEMNRNHYIATNKLAIICESNLVNKHVPKWAEKYV